MASYIIDHYPNDGFPATGAYPVAPEKPPATMVENGVRWFALPAMPGTVWELYHHNGRGRLELTVTVHVKIKPWGNLNPRAFLYVRLRWNYVRIA